MDLGPPPSCPPGSAAPASDALGTDVIQTEYAINEDKSSGNQAGEAQCSQAIEGSGSGQQSPALSIKSVGW